MDRKELKTGHIILLYAAIAVLVMTALGGCSVVVKQGTPAPVDPLTRKHY